MADILIVEDDAAVSWSMSILLDTLGHTTRTAANGFEGLKQLRARRPDLTVTDIEMPILDGPAMAGRILVEDQGLERVPILIISGFPDIAHIAREVGNSYFVAKPFAIDAFLEVLDRALRERIPPRPQSERAVG